MLCDLTNILSPFIRLFGGLNDGYEGFDIPLAKPIPSLKCSPHLYIYSGDMLPWYVFFSLCRYSIPLLISPHYSYVFSYG